MTSAFAHVTVSDPLRFFLPVRHRAGEIDAPAEEGATAGHLVESLGIPRTEIGALLVDGRPADFGTRIVAGSQVEVREVQRPQHVPHQRFLLDVHLGTLARRMRMLGIDTAYSNDADDPELVEDAIEQGRVLLTQDRGLLRRKALPVGAYVHGSDPDDQLIDVLERFDPPLDPWSRCPACNGLLEPALKDQVAHLLAPGTLRSYTEFAQCRACQRPYWRGAHADRLDEIIATVAAHRRAE